MFERLALAELRCTTCCLQTVLLALLHTRIAGQEASLLQGTAQLGISLAQGAGDAVTDGTSLTGHSTTADIHQNVEDRISLFPDRFRI